MTGEVTTLATLWKLTRLDGTIFGFTDHDADITYPVGGQLYEAASGYLPSATSQTGNLSVDNLDVQGFLESTKIKEADLIAGKYDYASVDIYIINYNSIADGVIIIASGWKLGEVSIQQSQFKAEIRSKSQQLQQNIVELYSPDCRASLGDVRCKVDLSPDDWVATTVYTVGVIVKATVYDGKRYICKTAGTSGGTEPTWDTTVGNDTAEDAPSTVVWTCYDAYTKRGTVSAVTTQAIFVVTGLSAYADDVFKYGKLTWLTGGNIGLSMEVKAWDQSTGVMTLFQKMVYTIAPSDTFSVEVGCDRKKTTCKTTFNNIYNFRGEPFVPGNDEVLKVGINS